MSDVKATGSTASLRRLARVCLAAWHPLGHDALCRGHRGGIGCPQASSSQGVCAEGIRLVVWRWTLRSPDSMAAADPRSRKGGETLRLRSGQALGHPAIKTKMSFSYYSG